MHQIRLRGPWQLQIQTADGDWSQPLRIRDQDDWPDEYESGAVSAQRAFHSPTGIESSQVDLVISGHTLPWQIQLNDDPLGTAQPGHEFRIEISDFLAARNSLTFLADATSSTHSCVMQNVGDVRLEIQ